MTPVYNFNQNKEFLVPMRWRGNAVQMRQRHESISSTTKKVKIAPHPFSLRLIE